MARFVFAFALGAWTASVNASDPRPLPETTVQHGALLNDAEVWLLHQYGGNAAADSYILNTTLRWQVQAHYERAPGGVDQAVADAKTAAAANHGRLGPLEIGDLDPDALQRCLITRQRFSSNIRAASTAFNHVQGPKKPPPAIVVSELSGDPGDALRHELIHVCRPYSGAFERSSVPIIASSLIQPSQYSQFFSPSEIDPRLAVVKRTYSLQTGRPVRNVAEASAAWEWAKSNAESLPMLTSSAAPRSVGNTAWFHSIERTAAAHWGGLSMTIVFRRMTQML